MCAVAIFVAALGFTGTGKSVMASADTDAPAANEDVLPAGFDSDCGIASGVACGFETPVTVYTGPTEALCDSDGETEFTIEEGVTEISDGEYANCTEIKKIVLPSSLTHIGYGAFCGCTALKEIDFPDGNNVQFIDGYAFYGCKSLTHVKVGDGAVVGEYAFAACDGLTDVEIGDGVAIGDYAFFGTLAPDYGTWYEEYGTSKDAEYFNTYVNEIYTRADGDGDNYFYDFEKAYGGSLTSVMVGAGCVIGSHAFANNVSLYVLEFKNGSDSSDGITVGDFAFHNCFSLTTPSFGNVSHIGASAFSVTHEVADLSVDEQTGEFGFAYKETVDGATEKVCFVYWGGLSGVLNLDSVSYIGEGAFAYNNNIANVFLSGGLGQIGAGAFYDCVSVSEVVGLEKVENIRAYALAYTALTSVSVKKGAVIGDGAFCDCTRLETANLAGAAYIGAYAFAETGLCGAMDVSGAEYIGDYAFSDIISDGVIEVVLLNSDEVGKLEEIGENPFRSTDVAFVSAEAEDGEGISYDETFSVTENVFVSDGVLYQTATAGHILLSYPVGKQDSTYTVEDGTVRIGADAFRGNEYLKNVFLPSELVSIGDAAFYGCEGLSLVVFTGYEAPLMEGDVFENLADAVMLAPANGKGYAAYAEGFGIALDGEAAVSPDALAVIAMIEALPGSDDVTLSDSEEIRGVLAAYDALTEDEKPLVTNSSKLFGDFDRLRFLEGAQQEEKASSSFLKDNMWGLIIALVILLAFVALLIYAVHVRKRLSVTLEAWDISEAAGKTQAGNAADENAVSEDVVHEIAVDEVSEQEDKSQVESADDGTANEDVANEDAPVESVSTEVSAQEDELPEDPADEDTATENAANEDASQEIVSAEVTAREDESPEESADEDTASESQADETSEDANVEKEPNLDAYDVPEKDGK